MNGSRFAVFFLDEPRAEVKILIELRERERPAAACRPSQNGNHQQRARSLLILFILGVTIATYPYKLQPRSSDLRNMRITRNWLNA